MYAAGLGRFVSRDPLGYVDGMGLYAGYFAPNSVDPSGLFKAGWHKQITNDAFVGSGLSEKCIKIIAQANVDQDAGVFTNSGPFADSLNHGDNNKIKETIEQMTRRWQTMEKCEKCDSCDKLYEKMKEFGKFLHALQDLYAHSTYVEQRGGTYTDVWGGWAKVGQIPLWPIWNPDNTPNVPAGVITGNYKWPDHGPSPSHAETNKDDPDTDRGMLRNSDLTTNFDLARDLATRHTKLAWETVRDRLPQNCKDLLNKCCGKK